MLDSRFRVVLNRLCGRVVNGVVCCMVLNYVLVFNGFSVVVVIVCWVRMLSGLVGICMVLILLVSMCCMLIV